MISATARARRVLQIGGAYLGSPALGVQADHGFGKAVEMRTARHCLLALWKLRQSYKYCTGYHKSAIDTRFKVLKEQAEHHHKEEAEHLFPKVQGLLDADRLQQLGAEMIALQTQQKMEGWPHDNVTGETDAAAPL